MDDPVGDVILDIALFIALGIGGIAFLAIPIMCYLIIREAKNIRKELKEVKHSINNMNTSLLHQGSKISLVTKHLAIIGSAIAPDRYKTKRAERAN